jgi:hypothetical protein
MIYNNITLSGLCAGILSKSIVVMTSSFGGLKARRAGIIIAEFIRENSIP